MWSQIFLCALVGLVAASPEYAWKTNTEYTYKVQGRTLTGLHDVADQYSGILMRANLIVRPQSNGKLMAKIANAKYAQIHANLPEGWKSEISESKLNFRQLQLSESPFEIIMKNGVVRDLIVSKEVHNWEANIIKSIVSQLQLDTQGENVIKSHINQLPEEGSNNAVFKTMEDTVTGKYETLYDISPLPEYVLQSKPWIAPMPQLKNDGEFIEIIKNKNFSRGEQRPGYHFGLGDNNDWEPHTNQMGDFFLRSSISRAIISGDLKRYTIQSSSTTNKIILSPILNSAEKGMVVSHLNLTLADVKQTSSQLGEVQQPQRLGSLVYSYNAPFSTSHEARASSPRQEADEYEYSSEEQQPKQRRHYRHKRAALSSEQENESSESEENWTQDQPQMHLAPQSPLLPMYVGYKGKSIKQSENVNVVEAVQKLCQQIGREIQNVEDMPKEQTLAKFAVMIRLVRIMNEKEMQEAAQQLYSEEQKGPKADAWAAFRDAISESGTGPALLAIKNLIQSKKIQTEEAAQVIATLAQSTRQPTDEYMRTFYALATSEQVKSQAFLNQTAVLSYATLVRKVYVDKYYSHNQYPVQSFGSFRSNSGKQFVTKEFIPYLKQQLNNAIENADNHKVLVYIRALGNVAHQNILGVFEKYLEGEKQVSQFQRIQMVLAMDKLVNTHPKVARSVLYKIYQNAGEMQEIRVAAVFQIMRTNPPASMLQRMAHYTNDDTNEQVNAAVKSALETAAEVDTDPELRENARAALPLLTKNTFGVQYSQNSLRDYVVKEMNLIYQQNVQSWGSFDSWFPKGLRYRLSNQLGGVEHELFHIHAMVSSVDELTNALAEQTESHQQKKQEQRENYQESQNNKYSSESISRLLNLKIDEREQIEGNFLFQLGGGAARYFTFDNRTVELIPSVLNEIENILRQGEDFHVSKFINRKDMVISFPTEMALPFIYRLEAPTLVHIKGQVRASAEPKISSGEKLRAPNTVKVESQLEAVLSAKVQSRLGFVTPFEHQKYVSGFDKNLQVYVPIRTNIEIDIQKREMRAQVQPIQPEKSTAVLHYSTWPYTSKQDLLKFQPLSLDENTHIIYANGKPQTHWKQTYGKPTGLAFTIEYSSDQQAADSAWFFEQLNRHDPLSALMAPFFDETVHQRMIDIKYDAEESSAQKVNFYAGYEKRYETEEAQESDYEKVDLRDLARLPRENKARQIQMAKLIASGIQNAEVGVLDFSVEFEGNSKVKYSTIAGLATSVVDEKVRAMMYSNDNIENSPQSRPYMVAVSAKARIPNTSALDFVDALKHNPTTTAEIEVAVGKDMESAAQFKLNAHLQKSEDRKRYLQSHPRAQECRQEMKQGNQQLPACANMTAEANLMDRVRVELKYDRVGPKVQNMTQKLYSALRYFGYANLEENLVNPRNTAKPNHIELEARFNPDFESVNVTLRSEKMESQFRRLRVDNWAKQVFAIHPVYPAYTRVMSEALNYESYRPTCVIDKTSANTFDNKTYPVELGNNAHVVLVYAPAFARHHEQYQKYQKQQYEQQTEHFAVLTRDSKTNDQKRELKITVRAPETQGQLVEIDVKPLEGQEFSGTKPCAMVKINKKEIQVNDQQTADVHKGFIQIYALPTGEVKVDVNGNFYVVFDGERVKVAATHDKFRDALRGLCGTFSGEQTDEFRTPKNCILRNPFEFASTWAIEEDSRIQELKSRAEKADCYYDDIVYANVVSEYDAGHKQHNFKQGRQQQQYKPQRNSNSCVQYRTRYVESEEGTCFTISPQPVCHSSCQAGEYNHKQVAVHCVKQSNVSDLWKEQINRGASPDFSHKAQTKTMKIALPKTCSA